MLKRLIFIAIAIAGITSAYAQVVPPQPYPTTTSVINYTRTWDAAAPITSETDLLSRPLKDVKQATQYSDGLGRSIQSVARQGSLATGSAPADLVTVAVFDGLGRQPYQYLPFVANSTDGNTSINDGKFKSNPFQEQAAFATAQYPGEQYFYSKTNFEASPLSTVVESYAPGNSWAGSESNTDPAQRRSVQVKYSTNTAADNVRIWLVTNSNIPNNLGSYSTSLPYPAGKLSKLISTDEHGKQVIEFKDMNGQTVLRKVQLTAVADDGTGSGYAGWICTYSIYDDLGRLRCTVLPQAVDKLAGPLGWQLTDQTILDELTFRYEYDARGRTIRIKAPGAGETWMVYDAKDRLVMKQDANMRNAAVKKWLYYAYDQLDRVTATGLITDPANYSNLSYHLDAAYNRTIYPILSDYMSEELTNLFYDGYAWLGSYSNPLPSIYNSSFDSYFSSPSNTAWPYPQQNSQSMQVRGLPTGSRTKIIGTNNYLYSIILYDSKGRAIQSHSTNITGGTDIITTQYTWAGQPLTAVQKEDKQGSNGQVSVIISKVSYDDLGRVAKTEKKISNTLVNGGAMPAAFATTARMEYDNLGRLKKKSVGNKPNNQAAALASSNYDYNIRGWLTAINGNYVENAGSDDQYFGMQLAYDKNPVSATSPHQYNGQIGGMVWKSAGDQQKRKYDFGYDAANRLTGATFGQYVSGVGQSAIYDLSAGIDFTVNNLAYDLNGNISTMNQKGLLINQSSVIDQMVYTYMPNSNKLLNVFDGANNAATLLGDFRFKPSHPQYAAKLANANPASITDYLYDDNGNITTDYNKDIKASGSAGITYNYLNLPQQVQIEGKGTITNTYDAGGAKLKAVKLEPAAMVHYNGADYVSDITTTTIYNGGFVYEGKTYSNPSLNALNKPDVLLFAPQEEGRIRFRPAIDAAPVQPAALVYDYMLKDHLGNIRVVLTEEQLQDKYPIATLETAKLSIEKGYYDIQDANIADRSGEVIGIPATASPNYKNNNGIGNNPSDPAFENTYSQKLYRLNSTGAKTGLGITLKVMTGDRIDVFGKSYYFTNNAGGPAANSSVPINMILGGLLGGATGGAATSIHGPVDVASINNAAGTAGLSPMVMQQNSQSANAPFDKPRAFINVVFFDEQFKAVADNFRVSMVGGNSQVNDHYPDLQNIIAAKSGYVYIYCSNESPVNVYFDNLQVVHSRSPVLETNEFYPYGMKMDGISYKAAGAMKNPYLYQGEYSEHDDWTEWNDFALRGYDAQTGRFMQQDPYDEFPSPYTGMANDPVNNTDPSGGSTNDYFKGVCSGSVIWMDRTDNFTMNGELFENVSSGRWIDDREVSMSIDGHFSMNGHFIWEPGGRKSFFRSNGDIAQYGSGDIPQATVQAAKLNWAATWDNANNSFLGRVIDPVGISKMAHGTADLFWTFGSTLKNGWRNATNMNGEHLLGKYGAKEMEWRNLITFGSVLSFAAGGVGGEATAAVDGTKTAAAEANGSFYSVAYEMELAETSYPGVSRYMHFKEANISLEAAMETNPALGELGISVPKSAKGTIIGEPPPNWVWHHDVKSGIMQLVPKIQHPNIPGGIFWETLHPGGRGGFSIWGK